MKHNGFRYEVRAVVTFSKEEINGLLKVSARHYDGLCQSIGRPGRNSFLWGMRMMMGSKDASITEALSFRELDLLCKITEMSAYHDEPIRNAVAPLWFSLHQVLNAINEEYEYRNRNAA